MARVYNFSAGPSMLPEAVLEKAASEMLDYHGSGQSVRRCLTAPRSMMQSSRSARLFSEK